MKPSLPDSPVKPALLSVLGSLIACSVFLALPLFSSRMHHSRLLGGYLVFCLAVFVGATIFSLTSVGTIKQGIENQRWTEAQIEPLRAHLESPYYTALSIGLLVPFAIFEFVLQKRFGGLGWGCFLLSQTISQLRIALKRPRSSNPPIDWHKFTPIHSDHWGSR